MPDMCTISFPSSIMFLIPVCYICSQRHTYTSKHFHMTYHTYVYYSNGVCVTEIGHPYSTWSYTSTPPIRLHDVRCLIKQTLRFMPWHLVKRRDNFIILYSPVRPSIFSSFPSPRHFLNVSCRNWLRGWSLHGNKTALFDGGIVERSTS